MSPPKIAVIVQFTAHAGHRDALVAAFAPMFDQVAGEPGTEVYSLHLDTLDDDVIWLFQVYADEASMNAHSTSDVARAANTDIRQYSAARVITVLHPQRAKGLVL